MFENLCIFTTINQMLTELLNLIDWLNIWLHGWFNWSNITCLQIIFLKKTCKWISCILNAIYVKARIGVVCKHMFSGFNNLINSWLWRLHSSSKGSNFLQACFIPKRTKEKLGFHWKSSIYGAVSWSTSLKSPPKFFWLIGKFWAIKKFPQPHECMSIKR